MNLNELSTKYGFKEDTEPTNKHFGFIVKNSAKERFDACAKKLGLKKVALLYLMIDMIEGELDFQNNCGKDVVN